MKNYLLKVENMLKIPKTYIFQDKLTHYQGSKGHSATSDAIMFTLVVDNFGVKYANKDNVDHLIASIKKDYMLIEDWTGNLYCGIQLNWDYAGRTVNISMPGYIKKKLQEYGHIISRKIQGCPYSPEPKIFGTEAQAPFPQDNTPKLDKKGIKRIQIIVGSISYNVRAVNMTVLMALSTIAVNQTKATKRTMERCTQLLDYLAHNADAKVRFHASDMILNIHSDASYLSEAKARSTACRHFFHEMDAQKWGTHTIKWGISR
jgi:hypothetical protein